MKIKVFSLFLCFVLIALCLLGCKDAKDTGSDLSSNSETVSSVPIVIVDGEKDNSSATQSEIDEIINDWENNTPNISIETDTSSTNSTNSTSSKDNNSNTESSSKNQKLENSSSTDNNSNESSSDTVSDETESENEDDGYFDVAV